MLQTTDAPLGPVDLSEDVILKYIDARVGLTNTAYPRFVVEWIVAEVVHWTGVYGLRTSFVMAQILHETDFFRYTGDVKPDQYNFAGLGATGGVPGWSVPKLSSGVELGVNARITLGVLAVCTHHLVYIYGPVVNWPTLLQGNKSYDPRYTDVLTTGKAGSVDTIADYGAKWAVDTGYPVRILIKANDMLAMMPQKGGTTLRLALTSGHHNSDGGDALEIVETGQLVEAIYREAKARNIDVRVITPDGPDADTDPGDGQFPGGLWDAARKVVEFANAGWKADVFLECHTQGGGGRGVFGIYPDWQPADGSAYDLDEHARDNLIPAITSRVDILSDLGLWTDGVMSEKQTGVGGQGFRLGIFRATEPVRSFCTRLIIEFGAHDNADEAIIRSAGFYAKAATAVVNGLFASFGATDPAPQSEPERVRHFGETGCDLTLGFLTFFETIEPIKVFNDVPLVFLVLGYPIENERGVTLKEGQAGSIQRFERGWLLWDSKQPDGWSITLAQTRDLPALGVTL